MPLPYEVRDIKAKPPILMFPRGEGPLISIMIASRGRSECLHKAITTTYQMAYDKHCMEFIVKLDDDECGELNYHGRLLGHGRNV